jgi:hypothetical protein
MQNVAAKKAYVVPVVATKGTVEDTTLGVPHGFGESTAGFIIFAAV